MPPNETLSHQQAPSTSRLATSKDSSGKGGDGQDKPEPFPERGLDDGGKLLETAERDPFTDPAIIAKSRKAAKLFGLDENQFQKALSNAKEEWETGVPPADADGYSSAVVWATAINYGLLFAVFCGLIWAVNRDYGNMATRFFVQLFPREAVALGLATVSPEEDTPEDPHSEE